MHFTTGEVKVIGPKLWFPKRVIFTEEALKSGFAQKIYEKVKATGIEIIESKNNRLTGIKGKTDAETYRNAKSTLAIVKAPEGMFRLQPIPPSADYQFHLAQGCPAHCQYCYLAGSLSGLPVVKAFGNLDAILENSRKYDREDKIVSYEVSCYTDPLSLEHLTGSLSESIIHMAHRHAHLRWVTKFDNIETLLHLDHMGKTRCRFSVNPEEIVHHFEGGAAPLLQRLHAAKRLGGKNGPSSRPYPIGLVVAPIMSIPDWEDHYTRLFEQLREYLHPIQDLTFEFITHLFTKTSKNILEGWYPASKLSMEESERVMKFNKFGGVKYVYPNTAMKTMKAFFYNKVETLFPDARILYWT